jgi:acetoin utilization deacetylase AcuC-like enzyme
VRVFAGDRWPLPLPPGHRFPQAKYRMLRERMEASGLLREGELEEPEAADDATLALAHDPAYVARVARGELTAQEQRAIGFPWSEELVERSRRSVGATIGAARGALRDGVGASLSGGTHHAFADRGEGFCVFNDVAVAARLLQREGAIRRAVVVDLDVHQGNGTAAIFAGDPSVFTLSLHGARNYPLRKELGDLDVALPDGCGDDEYLAALAPALGEALRAARAELCFYLAGADAFEGDRLGRLALTKAGLARRDAAVFEACAERGVPVAVVMGGGYAADLGDVVDIQAETLRQAISLARRLRP